MSTPILPVVKRSPSIFVLNGAVYYFDQSGAKVKTARGIEDVKDDFFGVIGHRSKGNDIVDITFTPTGIIRNLDLMYRFSGDDISGWYGGQSIFQGVGYFNSKAGDKNAYARAGILKPPTMNLHPTKPLFGPMTVRCIKSIALAPNNAAALTTLSSTAFADVSFDETLIKGDNYSVALGARSAPFNAMGPRQGVEIEPIWETEDVTDDGVGIADTLIRAIGWKVKFAPNNLTEAQLITLAEWQGSDAVIAGEEVSKLNEDLVIDGEPLTVTLYKAGVTMAEGGWGVAVDRNGNVEFTNRMTFTTGVPDPLIDFTINI